MSLPSPPVRLIEAGPLLELLLKVQGLDRRECSGLFLILKVHRLDHREHLASMELGVGCYPCGIWAVSRTDWPFLPKRCGIWGSFPHGRGDRRQILLPPGGGRERCDDLSTDDWRM